MSSTYVHYSAPSSLPSDYALVSRYAAAHDLVHEEENAENIPSTSALDENDGDDDEHEGRGIAIKGGSRPPRRDSLQSNYLPPFNPTLGPLHDAYGHRSGPKPNDPNENTPLLAPPVPRIEEQYDREDDTGSITSNKMFWEEVSVLTKYTLPVFGCVPSTPFPRPPSHM